MNYGTPGRASLPEWRLPESNIAVLYSSPRRLCGAHASGFLISLSLAGFGQGEFLLRSNPATCRGLGLDRWKKTAVGRLPHLLFGGSVRL